MPLTQCSRRLQRPAVEEEPGNHHPRGLCFASSYSACLSGDRGTPSRSLEVRDNVRGET